MSKASRKNRKTGLAESRPSQANELAQPVARFVDRAGLILDVDAMTEKQRAWLDENVPKKHLNAIQKESRSGFESGMVDIKYRGVRTDPMRRFKAGFRSLDVARYTYGIADYAPCSNMWLEFLAKQEDLGPRVIDIGCGFGVTACFLAQEHPEFTIIGIDILKEAVRTARQLADELTASNTQFEQVDLCSAHEEVAGPFDTMTMSFTLMNIFSRFPPQEDPWSTIYSSRHGLEHCRLPTVQNLPSLLKEGGKFLGVERIQPKNYAHWAGALLSMGLQPMAMNQVKVPADDSAQYFPIIEAARKSRTSASEAWTALAPFFWSLEPEERRLAEDPPKQRIAGIELELSDMMGEQILSRGEVFELSSGAFVFSDSNSLGFRDLNDCHSDQTAANKALDEWLEAIEEYGGVFVETTRELGDEPIPQSRPDLLLN